MTRSLQDIYDKVAHAIFVLEPDAGGVPRYTVFNAFAQKAVGKALRDIVGHTAEEVYPGRLGTIAYDHHVATIWSGQPRTYEILLPLAAGERRVRTVLTPELDVDGRVMRIVGSSTDISGTQILREMRADMKTLNSEMEGFVNLAAHDLRTPMRHVAALADMLREDFQDLGDGKMQLIDLLEDVATKAMKLINDVLAHAEAVHATEDVVRFRFEDMMEELISVLDPLETCKITYPFGWVEGDRMALQIILRNLMDNAIKHARKAQARPGETNAEPLQLHVEMRSLARSIEISVRDNGAGFGDLATAFLSDGRLRKDSGFGLLGVRRLIDARGGTLTASRAGAGGALVTFALPGQICTETVH